MDTQMDRRSFCKNAFVAAAALVAAPVALGAVEPQAALADIASGTCTANVRVKPTGAPALVIGTENYAYLTSDVTPTGLTGPFPTSAVENNATYSDDGDIRTIIIPLVNSMFTLREIVGTSSDGMTIDKDASDGYKSGDVYTAIVVKVSSGASGNFSFAAKEYASFSYFKGSKSWNIEVVL
jgi:hypothetical protein